MSNNYVCKKMLIEALGGGKHSKNKGNDEYGVKYNEMKALSEIPDPFDCTPFNGPDPPIIDFAAEPVVWKRFCHPEGDFDIMNMSYNEIMPGYTVLFNGARRSGKTKLIKNICQRMRPWFPEVVIFTRTKASGEFFDIVPICRVIEGFDVEIFLSIFEMQRSLNRQKTRGEIPDKNTNILIILDDCLADKLNFSNELDSAFFEGRHLNITIFVSIQDIKGVAPRATTNCDFAFIFPFGDERSFITVKDKYCNFISKNQLYDFLNCPEIIKKFHIIGIDRAHRYNPIDRRIAYGCVDDDQSEPYVMGDKKMWEGSFEQLKQLGFEDWILKDDWGILKPQEYSKYIKKQIALSKNVARTERHESLKRPRSSKCIKISEKNRKANESDPESD